MAIKDVVRSRRVTVVSLLFFVPLAVILLTTIACLPAPIGDPEKAVIDKDLIGVWESVPPADTKNADQIIVVVRLLDAHTYYVQYLLGKKDDDGTVKEAHLLNYRAWTAPLGDEHFFCMESLDNLDYLDKQNDAKLFYSIINYKKDKNQLAIRQVKDDIDAVQNATTREQMEAAIKQNLNKEELYDKGGLTFRKLDKEDLTRVVHLRESVEVGLGHKKGIAPATTEPKKDQP